jgi:hypothetical protein
MLHRGKNGCKGCKINSFVPYYIFMTKAQVSKTSRNQNKLRESVKELVSSTRHGSTANSLRVFRPANDGGELSRMRNRAKEVAGLAVMKKSFEVTLLAQADTVDLFSYSALSPTEAGSLLREALPGYFEQKRKLAVADIRLFGGKREPFVGLRFESDELDEEREIMRQTLSDITGESRPWSGGVPHLSVVRMMSYAQARRVVAGLEDIVPSKITLSPATITEH